MPYRLGLDLGVASCALVTWHLDDEWQPARLGHVSLDIWQEPLLPAKSGGVGEPKKAARRAARQMRRGICRRSRKLRRIGHLAPLLGLPPITEGFQGGQTIHALRAKAAEERIELRELLAVFLHLAKNRGPSGDWVYAETSKKKSSPGNRAKNLIHDETKGAEQESEQKIVAERKSVVGGVRKLEELMNEAAAVLGRPSLTLGQYLHHRRTRGESVILGKPEVGLYPSRRLVEQEFHSIWDTQSHYYPALESLRVREEFFKTIFHQRPLKSPAPMVGRCPLEPTLPRAPAAQMAAQTFRIEKQLTDLGWGMGRRSQPLSTEQKNVARTLLHQQAEVSFTAILEAFAEAGCPGPPGRGLNMDRASRDTLKGNSTLAALRKLKLDGAWNTLDEKTQVQIINFLADLGSPDALDSGHWHENFQTGQKDPVTGQMKRRQFGADFIAFVNKMREHPKFGRLSAMGFDGKRMGYSIKALGKLNALMQQGWDERAAIDQTYPEHHRPKPVQRELPLPDETGNVVVDMAMRQVYRAVREAMKAMDGPPAQVIVELSRDMSLGLKKRGEIETKINVNKKVRRNAEKAIEAYGETASPRNVDRYLLWESQLHYCPYCASRIELSDILSQDGEIEREHILPRSLTRVGGKRSQIVLAHRSCNQEKRNRTPYQAFGGDPERWRIIEERAAQFEKNRQWGKAKLLLLKDWENEVLDNAAIADFTDRQFHESSWIAKFTSEWLRSICPPTERDKQPVLISKGEVTAHLRRIWKLDTVIPEVRYASSLPVLDREGVALTSADFQRHKRFWEGHDERAGGVEVTERRPDKRIDHRHHLVDALVISLTDRRLFKAMADHYRIESEKARRGERARLSRYAAPPVNDIRDLALDLVTQTLPRHKPDRHPNGALFERTAYGLSREAAENGDFKLALSKPLKALIDVKGASVEKIRKSLEKIESNTTRTTVLHAFDTRLASGTPLKQVFDEDILHPQFNKPIRRVRLLGNSADTATRVAHTNRRGEVLHKHYVHDGNAYLEVTVRDGKLVGSPRMMNMQAAMGEKGIRPASDVLRFWKGDTVKLADGSLHIIGEINSQGGGLLRLVPVTETCTFSELKKRGLMMRTVSGGSLASAQIVNV
jgi:CRISPR-associated endonuclease Csn1